MKKHFLTFMTNEGMTKGSKDCYCAYVNKAYELFSKPHILKTYPTIYDRMLDLTKRSRMKYCEYLISLLNVEIQSPLSGRNKDYLRKYKSGVTMLSRFVSSGTYPHNGSKQFSTKFSVSYSIDDLIDNFTFRIETQDRIYASKNCFPCRLLGSKIFASKSIYHKQYKDILNKTFYKTKFLVNDKRDYLTLEKIDALKILGGITIHTRNKKYDVYTDTFSGNHYTGCVKTKGKILEDLSLDHDKPLENIINSEIYKLPELKKLSDAIWKYHSKTGLTGTQLTTNFYDVVYVSLSIDEKRLLDEVAELYKHIELTIMDKRTNSALNNKIITTPPLGSDLCPNQENQFVTALNRHFKFFRREKENDTNVLISEKEGVDFDIDGTFTKWCNIIGIDCLIIDVAVANRKDIEEIESHWNRPTAYLFKNYGDESAGNIRNKIGCFIKDRYLGISNLDDSEPQVVLCFTTESKDNPIKDFYERQVFFEHYQF